MRATPLKFMLSLLLIAMTVLSSSACTAANTAQQPQSTQALTPTTVQLTPTRLPLQQTPTIPPLVGPVPDPSQCWYYPWGEGFIGDLYDRPLPSAQLIGRAEEGQTFYRVLARSEISVRVRTQSGTVGWMPFQGVLRGACDGVPFMQTRPDPPAGVCAVYLDYAHAAAVLRREPDHDSRMIAPVPVGEWMPVLARVRQTTPDGGWYKVRLASGQEGWLYAGIVHNLGTMSGPCADVLANP